MHVTPLVRREFALLARSKWLWVLTLPFFWVGNNFLTTSAAPDPRLTIGAASTAATILSFASIIVCFRSIIGERESGSIRITAGTPLSRTEILVGKALGRGLALALPLGLAILALTILGGTRYGPPPIAPFVGFLLASLALAVIYSNLVTAISATVSSTLRGAVLSLLTVWLLGEASSRTLNLYEQFTGQAVSTGNPPADPLLFLSQRLFPLDAYRAVVNVLLDLPNTHTYFLNALQATSNGTTGFAVKQVFGSNPPFYLTSWFAALTLLLWAVAPLALAALHFERIDLTKPVSTFSDRLAHLLPIQLRRLWTKLVDTPFTIVLTALSKLNLPSRWLAWTPVARREFTVKAQSLGTPVVFALTVLAVVWQLNGALPIAHETLGANLTLAAFQVPIALLGLFATVFIGFRSIVHERETGAIRYTTSTPISRSQIILGKIIALTFAVAIPLSYGLIIGGTLGIFRYGPFSPVVFVGVLAVAFLYLAFNAAAVVGLSTFASTSTRAATLGFAYLAVTGLWQLIHRSIYSLFVDASYPLQNPPPDTLYFLTRRLSPRQLFNVASNWLLGVGNSSTTYANALRIKDAASNPNHFLISPGLVVDVTFDGHLIPAVLAPWVAILLLVAGISVVLAASMYRFQTIDLT